MIRQCKFILLLCMALLLVGCLGPVKLPPMKVYTLKVRAGLPSPSRSHTKKTILVTTPVPSPGYGSSQMVYIEVPYNLRSFANSKWVASPSQMMLPIFADYVRSKGYFHAVVSTPFVGMTNYRLDTQLLVFQQEFIQPTSKVRVVIQATLVSGDTNSVLATKRFSVVVRAPGNNPYSGVLAANRAVGVLASQLASFAVKNAR